MQEASIDTPETVFERLAAEDRVQDYYSPVGERVLHAIYKENGNAADMIRSLIGHTSDVSASPVRHIINSRVRTLFSPEQNALAEAAMWRECGDNSRLDAISPLDEKKV